MSSSATPMMGPIRLLEVDRNGLPLTLGAMSRRVPSAR